MDANKPGWNDAMNGLPGLLGSGMPETCEAWRIGDWLASTIRRVQRPVVVPVELGDLIANTTEALKDASLTDFEYWERVASYREAYRARVRLFFSGDEVSLDAATLADFLGRATKKLERGIEKSLAYTDGVIMPTYFQHVVTAYEYTGLKNFVGQPFVRATAFARRCARATRVALPPPLGEGCVWIGQGCRLRPRGAGKSSCARARRASCRPRQ